jgi:hypothetical protein
MPWRDLKYDVQVNGARIRLFRENGLVVEDLIDAEP